VSGWLIRDCVSRCFVKGSFRIVLSIHGSDFPGSEIGCFEPGNVFQDLETNPKSELSTNYCRATAVL
jgi:hypothetical protein